MYKTCWEWLKKMGMNCGCHVSMPIKVPDGENEDFRCRVCAVKKMMKLKRENEELKKKVECIRNMDAE